MDCGNLQPCSLVEESSDSSCDSESLFDESDCTGPADDDVNSDTDLTDVDVFTNKNDEDEAWLLPNEDHPPEYYLQQLESFDEKEYTKQDYKHSSTRLIDRIEEQWNQCWTYLKKNYYRAYATVSVATLYIFFDWLLGQSERKDERKRRGTKLASSLETY